MSRQHGSAVPATAFDSGWTTGRLSLAPLVATLIGGWAGCWGDFLPASYLDGLRVLALVADPLEAGPDEEVTVKRTVYVPSDQTLLSESWSFCPLSLGAGRGFSCVASQCETTLAAAPDGSVSMTPSALALGCAARLASQVSSLPGEIPAGLSERLETVLRYVVTSSGGQRREAVARIPLHAQAVTGSRNRHPVILSVAVEGRAMRSGERYPTPVQADQALQIRVQLDPASLDTFTDEAGRKRTEDPVLSFFASAGRFAEDRAEGLDAVVTWKAEQLKQGQSQAELYVVARDLRGGQAVTGPLLVTLSR